MDEYLRFHAANANTKNGLPKEEYQSYLKMLCNYLHGGLHKI